MFADRVDRRLPDPVERPVAELRAAGVGEDPVQARQGTSSQYQNRYLDLVV